MAILGPLFDSNNGWYIVTTGEDGTKNKVTFSSPLDYYVSMGVMPIIGSEYVDLEDVDSEVESDEEMVQDEELVEYEQSPAAVVSAAMEDMIVDNTVFYHNLACINKQLEEALAATTPSNFTDTGPSTSSASIFSDSTMHLPPTSSGFVPYGFTNPLPSP